MGVAVEPDVGELVLAVPVSAARSTVVKASAVVAAAMPVFCVVMVLQPWRYCPEVDDSSGGCPALDRDVALLAAGVLTFLVASAVMLVALLLRPRPGEETAG